MQIAKTRTIEAAIGRWPGILIALGVDEKFLRNRHGPCPCCGGVDRFRYDDREGSGSYFCNSCGAGRGMDLLMKLFGWNFKEAADQVDSVIGNVEATRTTKERTEAEKVAIIGTVLKQSRKVTQGDAVWMYLNRRTGIESVPPDIRYHPGMKHSAGGVYPVMLAVMRDRNGSGVSVHRTYLTGDGQKAPVSPVKKFMQGKPLNGSAVWLGKAAEHIGIGEGIETSIASSMRFGMPVFAATSAGLMEAWIPPEGVKKVSIFADHDANYVGQSAAYKLASRLARDGYVVDVQVPEMLGSDWADA